MARSAGSHLGERQRQELQQFATLAKAKGITLIGVTMPFAPEVVRALERIPASRNLEGFPIRRNPEVAPGYWHPVL
jgi:hypothetical protein